MLTEKVTAFPLRVIDVSAPALAWAGSIACKPVVLLPGATVKLSELLPQASDPNEELLRPSSQSSIWRLDTIGTPRESAELTVASATAEFAESVCALTV